MYIKSVFYYCVFTRSVFRLKDQNNVLQTQITDYQREWQEGATHTWPYFGNLEGYLSNSFKCSKVSYVNYFHPTVRYCRSKQLIFQLIVTFSKLNISLKVIPHTIYVVPGLDIVTLGGGDRGELSHWNFYSTPSLKSYEKLGMIYCLDKNVEFLRRGDIWFNILQKIIWFLLILTIFLVAVLNVLCSTLKRRIENVLEEICFEFWDILRTITRQTINLKDTRFLLLEIIFVILLIVYENYVTLEIVVLKVPKPFSDLKELVNQNYTFVLDKRTLNTASIWLKKEFNTTDDDRRVLEADIKMQYSWIQQYFWKQSNSIFKYAVLDKYAGNTYIDYVTMLSEHLYLCHKLYPSHQAFWAMPDMYAFESPVSEYFRTGLSNLHASGVDLLLKNTNYEFSKYWARIQNRLEEANDKAMKASRDVEENNRFSNNMLRLKNWVIILCIVCALLIISFIVLFVEMLKFRGDNKVMNISSVSKSKSSFYWLWKTSCQPMKCIAFVKIKLGNMYKH